MKSIKIEKFGGPETLELKILKSVNQVQRKF